VIARLRRARWWRLRGPRQILRDLLTAKDGQTYAPARVYWCVGCVEFVVLAAWSVVKQGNPFDATNYGTGIAAILAAGGCGVWLTRKTEPGQ
jgi:hypothetical protein